MTATFVMSWWRVAPRCPRFSSCDTHVLRVRAGIAQVCAGYDVPLLVDEAHGGHFAFLPPASLPPPPPSALSCGADMVMQSTHKVLGAMTQVRFDATVLGWVAQGERAPQRFLTHGSCSPA